MKQYPSIPGVGDGVSMRLHTFDKIDGSNLRFEWSKKKQWYKFGTRKRLFDESDIQFGAALPLFMETLAEPLEKIIRKQRWDKVVVFAEFWGKNSFAGYHVDDDPKLLTLIDVSPHRKGILPPKDFLDLFGEFGPHYLGHIKWSHDFVSKVRRGEVENITFEGVVGKTINKKRIVMYKAKSQAWYDRVMNRFGKEQGTLIVNS
jgi:hypothetical protein